MMDDRIIVKLMNTAILVSNRGSVLRILILASLLAMVAACETAPKHQAIIGVWESDADRTLQSMAAANNIPAEVQTLLSNDFYGHLTVEYRIDTVRAHFDNQNYDTGYQPYEVVSVDGDVIVTREWNELREVFEESTTYLDGECIYGINPDYGFREYFCPAG